MCGMPDLHGSDPHALLLRVIAHDLLSPLTAIKWQAELLGGKHVSRKKRRAYIENIQASNQLGIMIAKHAHVAGGVLTKTYHAEPHEVLRSDVVQQTCVALAPQFERHSVALSAECAPDVAPHYYDPALLSLLVWATAKLFLSDAPAGGAVAARGIAFSHGVSGYRAVFESADLQRAEDMVVTLNQQVPQNSLDQSFVFALLMHAVAEYLGNTQIEAEMYQGMLRVSLVFNDPVA